MKNYKFKKIIFLFFYLFLSTNLLFSQTNLAPIAQGDKALEKHFSNNTEEEWSQLDSYDIIANNPENLKLLQEFLTQPISPEDNELGGYKNYMERMNNIFQNNENRLKLENKGIYLPSPEATNDKDPDGVLSFLKYIVAYNGKIFTITKDNKIIGIMPVIENAKSLIMLPVCISPNYEYSTKHDTGTVPILNDINNFLKLSGHIYFETRATQGQVDTEFSLNRESGRSHEIAKSSPINFTFVPTEIREKRCNQNFIPIKNFDGTQENVVSFVQDTPPSGYENDPQTKLTPVCAYKDGDSVKYFEYNEDFFYPLTAKIPGTDTSIINIANKNTQKAEIKKLRKEIFNMVDENELIDPKNIVNIPLPSTFKDTVTLDPQSRHDLTRTYNKEQRIAHFEYEPKIFITKREFSKDKQNKSEQFRTLMKSILKINIQTNKAIVSTFLQTCMSQLCFGKYLDIPVPNLFEAPYMYYFGDHLITNKIIKSDETSTEAKIKEFKNILTKVINLELPDEIGSKVTKKRKVIKNVFLKKVLRDIKYKYLNIRSKNKLNETDIQSLINHYISGDHLYAPPLSTRTQGDFAGDYDNAIENLVRNNKDNFTMFLGDQIKKIHGQILRDCKIKGNVEGTVNAEFKNISLQDFEVTNATIHGTLTGKSKETNESITININETNFSRMLTKDFIKEKGIFTGTINGQIKGNLSTDINKIPDLSKELKQKLTEKFGDKFDEEKEKLKAAFNDKIINGFLNINLDGSYLSLNFEKEVGNNLFTTVPKIIASSIIKEEQLSDEEIKNIASKTNELYKSIDINIETELNKTHCNINNDWSLLTVNPKTGKPSIEVSAFAETLFGISAQKILLLSLMDPDRPFLTHTWAPSDDDNEGTFNTLLKVHKELVMEKHGVSKNDASFNHIINNKDYIPFVSFIRDVGTRGRQTRSFNLFNNEGLENALKNSKSVNEPMIHYKVTDLKKAQDCQINDEDWNQIKDLYICKTYVHYQNFLDLNNKPLIKGIEKDQDGNIKLKIEGIMDQISMLCLLSNQEISNTLYTHFMAGTVVFIEKLIRDKDVLSRVITKILFETVTDEDIEYFIEKVFNEETIDLPIITKGITKQRDISG